MHIGHECTRDVYAKESGLAKYQFTHETIDVYSCGVYDGMLDLDTFAPSTDQRILKIIA